MKLFFLALLAGIASSCYVAPDRANGVRLEQNAFTSQVLLEVFYSYNNKQLCTGNLISNKYILTSASCVFGAMFVNAHLGAFDLKNVFELNRSIYKTEKVMVKPQYNKLTNENNIALVELATTLNMAERAFSEATLPLRNNNFVGNLQDGVTIGWGTEFESFKQQIDGKILTKQDCESAHPIIGSDSVGQFCVQRQDSLINCVGGLSSSFYAAVGSPAEYTLIGFQSFVDQSTCDSGASALFTEITAHYNWITQETGILFQ